MSGQGRNNGEAAQATAAREREKRRHDPSSDVPQTGNASASPWMKRVKMSQTETSQHDRMQPSVGDINESVSRPMPLSVPNSELLHFRPHQHDNLESFRQLIELSRLASLTRPPPSIVESFYPNVGSMLSWPAIDFPRTHPYQTFLDLSGAQHHDNPFSHSSFRGTDPLYSSLSSHQHSAIASHPNIFPHAPSAPFAQLNAMVTSQQRFESAERASIRAANSSDEVINPHRRLSVSSRAAKVPSGPASPVAKKSRPKKKKGKAKPVATMTLYTSNDHGKLNDNQIFLRKQIEVFSATEDDLLTLTRGKNKPIVLQQVGLRCRFCSHVPVGGRKKGATYFPSNLIGIYQAAQNLSVEHLLSGLCTELPADVREQFSKSASGKPAVSGAGKKYWAEAAGMLGLVDTEDGIRFSTDLR